MRQDAHPAIGAAGGFVRSANDDRCQFDDRLVPPSAFGRDATVALLVSSLAMGGSGKCGLRLDAAGCRFVSLGVFRLPQDPQKKDRSEDQGMGEPQTSHFRSCRGFRTDSSMV